MDLKRRRGTAPQRPSRIFSPFRSLGNVTNDVPFAVGTLGSTFYLVTSVGKSFQIFDAATLHLLFVLQTQTAAPITALAAHFHYVYAGYGNAVGIYRRGRLEEEVRLETPGVVTHILPFGDFLIVVSSDGAVAVFKKGAGSKLPTQHHTTITAVSPEFDGPIVGLVHPATYLNKVCLVTTQCVWIVNVRTGKVVFKDSQFAELLLCVETAPVLDLVALGTATGGVYLYNLKQGRILGERITASPADTAATVTSVSFRSDGSPHLVAALNTGDLYFHNLAKRARLHVYREAHSLSTGGVANAKFLNGQPIVVTNGGDNVLRELAFDPVVSGSAMVTPPRHLRSRGGHLAPPTSLVFPDDDKTHFVYSASKDQTMWSFSLRKDAQAQEMSQRPQKTANRKAGAAALFRDRFPEVTAMAMSEARAGEWENMVTAHKDEHFARTWLTKTKRVGRHELATVDGGLAKAVCVSHCGNFALVGSSSGGIGAYNLQSGLLRRKYMLHKKCVTGLAIDGMNRKMVSAGLDGVLGFYNFAELTYLGKLQLDAPVSLLSYHKGSDLVACALDDLSIVVVDAVTQKVVRVLYGHSNRITGLDFSPDGRWIVSVSLDATMRTWDLPTGGCIDGVHLPSVATNVKFSPIGDFLATTHVTGNGIFLWVNRAQFKPVSTRHVAEEEFSTILLPTISGEGGASLIEGALDDEDDADVDVPYQSVEQVAENLVTLSLGPRTRYQSILHVDIIKSRNKPKEPPKKPELAPFFLQLSGEVVGDSASVAEGAKKQLADAAEPESRLRELRNGDVHAYESTFTRLLRESHGDYTEFLAYLVAAAPATIDLELRSIALFPPLDEMAQFVEAMTQGLATNRNYDIYQAILGLFLKHHQDVIYNHPEEKLRTALANWAALNESQGSRLDDLVKYCSGVINFLA